LGWRRRRSREIDIDKSMHKPLAIFAAAFSAIALYLPTRTQSFTRVAVDGRSMRMLVTGTGGTTVVFENGLGSPLETWGRVQPKVSRFARTVTYDRAGTGLSDAGPRPRDARHIAAELHQALRAASVAPPYIVVGASFGGPCVRTFAGMYPSEVAGLVLVDPTTDRESIDAAARLPELQAMRDSLDQANARPLPDIPVLLIDALSPADVPFASATVRALRTSYRAGLEEETVENKRWIDAIAGGRLIVTRRSGHNVAQEQPDLVVAAIKDVVDEAAKRPRR